MNVPLWFTGFFMLSLIEILEEGKASLHGKKLWTMLKSDQIDIEGNTAFDRFYPLAKSLYLKDGSATPLTMFATEPALGTQYLDHAPLSWLFIQTASLRLILGPSVLSTGSGVSSRTLTRNKYTALDTLF